MSKKMEMKTGTYRIRSKRKSQKCYIGSAINIHKRWREHLNDLRNERHKNKKLQFHFNKYGEADLQFTVLCGCDPADLLSQEQFYIDAFNPWFNVCPTAGNSLGRKLSEATKKKISDSHKGKHTGRPMSEETRRKLREAQKNRKPMSEETREKIREKARGRKASEETKRKLSLARKGRKLNSEVYEKIAAKLRGRVGPNFGKRQSEETKKKISEAHKGKRRKPFTEEVRKNMSLSKKGKKYPFRRSRGPHSEETKRKISVAHNGMKTPLKARRNISEALRKRSKQLNFYFLFSE